MLKRELEILLKDAQLAIRDLEKENKNYKARNEALTRFIAAISLNVTGIVEPKKRALEDIRAALSATTDEDKSVLEDIRNIINSVLEDKKE